MDQQVLDKTTRLLHGVAELVLAGPQYRLTGDVRLRVCSGGFGTTRSPDLRVDGLDLVAGGRRIPLQGKTFVELAEAAGIHASPLTDVYEHGPHLHLDDLVELDVAAASAVHSGLAIGEQALRRFAPDQTPTLWSEHFDVRTSIDGAHFGVCCGDNYISEPYAYIYVAPDLHRDEEVWNASFGAARRLCELAGVDEVHALYEAGRSALAKPRR